MASYRAIIIVQFQDQPSAISQCNYNILENFYKTGKGTERSIRASKTFVYRQRPIAFVELMLV